MPKKEGYNMPKYKVNLREEERKELQELVKREVRDTESDTHKYC